jgi:hypothetical protein
MTMPMASSPQLSWEQAASLLGVSASAIEKEIRRAYLDRVRAAPPDREPELFERIRDAYEQLRDPAVRARQVLEGPSPALPLPSLLDGLKPQRRFVASTLWLNVLKEKV